MPAGHSLARISAGAFAFVLSSIQAAAQQTAAPNALTLGEAARLAARQSTPSLSAQLRAREAMARVTQARAGLLPSLDALALKSGHTLNSATFGISFPAAPGENPFFDPNGQIIGPVNTLDVRGRVTVPAVDFAARQ
jgi:outer membrane protein TolC